MDEIVRAAEVLARNHAASQSTKVDCAASGHPGAIAIAGQRPRVHPAAPGEAGMV